MPDVIKQKSWTEPELRAMGFQPYQRKREIIWARVLPPSEAPKAIKASDGTVLYAQAGHMICYRPGEEAQPSLDDYDQWPVEDQIFAETYTRAEETLRLSPAERHLAIAGCLPYYKASGVWAKEITEDTYVQSLEHPQPVLVESGHMMAIGTRGEPYAMSQDDFHTRYEPEGDDRKRGLLGRLIRFLRG